MTHLIVTYGYFAVFFLVGAESLGLPLPGETTLILASAYAGRTHHLSVWTIFFVAAAATMIGDNIGYWIGAKGGYRLLRRFGPMIRIDDSLIKVGWYIFERHGAKIVFFGRFVSILRTYAAFLAGVNRMPWRRFAVCNMAGGVIWSAIYTYLAYTAANFLDQASSALTIVAIVGIVVGIAVTLVLVRRGTARLTQRAEAAFPGPLDEARP